MVITEEGIRVDCSVIDSKHTRNVVLEECYLRLYDKHIEYKNVYAGESDDYHDAEGIWKDTRSNYRFTRMRSDISEVVMYYNNPEQLWVVAIDFNGIPDATGWIYDSPKEALKLYNTLQDYFITR